MVYINRPIDENLLVRRAAQEGVAIYAGTPYHLTQPPSPSIILGFSGLNKKQINEGVRRLAEIIHSLSHVNGHHR